MPGKPSRRRTPPASEAKPPGALSEPPQPGQGAEGARAPGEDSERCAPGGFAPLLVVERRHNVEFRCSSSWDDRRKQREAET